MTKLLQKSKTLTQNDEVVKQQCQGHMMVKVIMPGHDLSNNVCEYEVNRLTNEKVIRGKRNFNANCQ